MECNKDEARRAMDIAERKVSENEYTGAKKFVNKAQALYPNLDGLKQVLIMIDVYISATNKINGEADWYGVLGVDPLADDEAVKKQYKKLALLLHPDKNKFKAAEVLPATSDKPASGMPKPSNPQKSASSNGRHQNPRDGVDPSAKAGSNKHAPAPADSSKQTKDSVLVWTMCNGCKKMCSYMRDYCHYKVIQCQNCGYIFIATQVAEPVNCSPSPQQQHQYSSQNKETSKSTHGASSSGRNSSPSASTATEKTPQASAKSQATNKNTNGAFSTERVSSPSVSATAKTPPRPVNNSSLPTQQQQWSTQNHAVNKSTNGESSSGRNSSSSASAAQKTPQASASSSARVSSPSVSATEKTPKCMSINMSPEIWLPRISVQVLISKVNLSLRYDHHDGSRPQVIGEEKSESEAGDIYI
ncbi:unnamed protein product [Arabidopsis lyrata]|nr:unnamed protein product [Arabidopsis lyrata]